MFPKYIYLTKKKLFFNLLLYILLYILFYFYRKPVNCISIHPTGKLALSVSKDMTLRTWNLIKGRSAYVTNLIKGCLFGIILLCIFSHAKVLNHSRIFGCIIGLINF